MTKNIIRGLAVGFVVLSLGVYAEAKPKGPGPGKGPVFQPQNINKVQFQNKPVVNFKNPGVFKNVNPVKFGKPVNPSFCYKGKNCCFWNHTCYCDWLGCDIFWCPATCHWFYFYEPTECYYIVDEVVVVKEIVVIY